MMKDMKSTPYYIYILMALSLLMAACDNYDISTSGKSQLVVEGWIDDGQFPIVKLTKTVPLTEERIDVDDLSKYVENWGKVTISDGEQTEVMMGRYDSKYNPPFVYTTYDMKGEVGKTYSIKAESLDGIVAEATTSIPAPIEIVRFEVEPTDVDSLFQLVAYVSDSSKRCKLFTMVEGEQTEYYSSQIGLFDVGMIGEDGRVIVKRGRNNLDKNDSPFFKRGDKVWVKLATIDDASYDFWRSFEDLVALSRVPLMPVSKNLKSNVTGALGYWCGYGAKEYCVSIDL